MGNRLSRTVWCLVDLYITPIAGCGCTSTESTLSCGSYASEKSYKACDGASCYPWRRRRKWTWSWRRWPRRWWRRLRRGWKLCGGASVWCDCAYARSSMHAKQWCSPRETSIYHPLIISSLSTGVNVCVFSNGVLLGRQ